VTLEFASVVARRVRTRELPAPEARAVLADFHADRAAGLYEQAAVHAAHYTQAQRWLESLDVPLRTFDALHLAVAHAGSASLLTADRKLAAAARKLGLRCRLVSA
jgi:predicted nucleic acid-binding protein